MALHGVPLEFCSNRAQELFECFTLIDANANGEIELSELQKVFGEHATELLVAWDLDGNQTLSCDEFVDGITKESKSLSNEDFETAWLDKMRSCLPGYQKPEASAEVSAEVSAESASAAEDTAEASSEPPDAFPGLVQCCLDEIVDKMSEAVAAGKVNAA